MNAHWTNKSFRGNALPVDTASTKTLSFAERAQDGIGRFGMFAIVAVLMGMMAYGLYLNQAATNDECFANFYSSECAR